MNTEIRKIVVGYDGSEELGDQVLADAIDLARRERQAEVHVVRVIEPIIDAALAPAMPIDPKSDLEHLRKHLEELVRNEIGSKGELRIGAVVAHIAVGSPSYEIVDLAAQIGADVIVVGTHARRGLRRALLGSVAEHVVRLAGCPVLVTRPKTHAEPRKVPAVEPLCPDCAQIRADTNGQQLWCERHSEHHPRAHVYSYEGRSSEGARPWGFHG
jgi:nucleotide-binding universal stress UspA family protein